jgi:hypothetical protein
MVDGKILVTQAHEI